MCTYVRDFFRLKQYAGKNLRKKTAFLDLERMSSERWDSWVCEGARRENAERMRVF